MITIPQAEPGEIEVGELYLMTCKEFGTPRLVTIDKNIDGKYWELMTAGHARHVDMTPGIKLFGPIEIRQGKEGE
jgi:hypothetical protein